MNKEISIISEKILETGKNVIFTGPAYQLKVEFRITAVRVESGINFGLSILMNSCHQKKPVLNTGVDGRNFIET